MFFVGELKDWMQLNLSSNSTDKHGIPWKCIFGVAIYSLWFWRNCALFDPDYRVSNKIKDILNITRKIHCTMISFGKFTGNGKLMVQKEIRWSPL